MKHVHLKSDSKNRIFIELKSFIILLTIFLLVVFTQILTCNAQNTYSNNNAAIKPQSSVLTTINIDSIKFKGDSIISVKPIIYKNNQNNVTNLDTKSINNNQQQPSTTNLTEIEKYESTDPKINKPKK